MRIDWTKLKRLDVETKSGVALGHVKDFVLETEGQSVLQYEVGGVIGKKYLVSREQVISIDEKKMVVEDNVKKIENKDGENIDGRIDIEPVAMRNEY